MVSSFTYCSVTLRCGFSILFVISASLSSALSVTLHQHLKQTEFLTPKRICSFIFPWPFTTSIHSLGTHKSIPFLFVFLIPSHQFIPNTDITSSTSPLTSQAICCPSSVVCSISVSNIISLALYTISAARIEPMLLCLSQR